MEKGKATGGTYTKFSEGTGTYVAKHIAEYSVVNVQHI